MSASSKSFGLTIGRGIGYSAAAVSHGAAVAVKATGQFGADVVTGTTTGYAEHSARLAALRAGMPTRTIAINVKRPAKATA